MGRIRVRYQISLADEMSALCRAAFPDLEVTDRPGGGTCLSGELADQAALIAVLLRLDALGLRWLEVRQLPD